MNKLKKYINTTYTHASAWKNGGKINRISGWIKKQGVGTNCFFRKHKKESLLEGCEGWIPAEQQTSYIKAWYQKKEEEWGEGEKGCNEKAAAAALVTQLATALVCSAQPCRGKLSSHARTLSSLHYGSTAVVKVTSSLDWGGKKSSHSKYIFSNAELEMRLACVLNIRLGHIQGGLQKKNASCFTVKTIISREPFIQYRQN